MGHAGERERHRAPAELLLNAGITRHLPQPPFWFLVDLPVLTRKTPFACIVAGMPFKKAILLRICLSILALIITIVFIELVLRSFGYRGVTGTSLNYLPDPELGWVPKESYTYIRGASEYSHRVSYNSLGFRGQELDLNAPKRVMFLGDSFTEATQVPHECTFAEIVRERLLRDGFHVDVANMGVSGYSTDQELLYYLRYAEQIRTDLVIVMFYGDNDVQGNVGAYETAYSKPILDFDALAEGDVIVSNSPIRNVIQDSRPIWKRSALLMLLSNRMMNTPFLVNLAGRLVAQTGQSLTVGANMTVPPSESILNAHEASGQILRVFSRKVEERGGRFLVCYVPSKVECDRDLVSRLFSNRADVDPNQPELLFKNMCAKNGIDCISVRQPLEKHIASGISCYYRRDSHWNQEGHRVVAESLYATIRQHMNSNATL